MTSWSRSEASRATVKFWGQSYSLGNYPLRYQPPKGVYLLTIWEKSSRRETFSAHEVSIPCLRTLCDKEREVLQTAGLTASLVTVLDILFISWTATAWINLWPQNHRKETLMYARHENVILIAQCNHKRLAQLRVRLAQVNQEKETDHQNLAGQ